jgi:hypothetical protein
MAGGRLIVRDDQLGFVNIKPDGKHILSAVATSRPVQISKEERAELETLYDWYVKNGLKDRSVIPSTKPVSGGAQEDITGRVWIWRHTESVKGIPVLRGTAGPDSIYTSFAELPVYSAFDPDGTYLGDVEFPAATYIALSGDVAWGLSHDPKGEHDIRLVKYRFQR